MGEGLGPVLPRVHGGVGRDVAVLPPDGPGPAVVGPHGRVVVGPLVAEAPAELVEVAAVAHEHHPVVVAHLVAEVAEHGAVGLAQLVAHPLAVGVVGLGQVDGDEPVLVAGGHRVEPAGQQVEPEALRLLGEPDHRQPEVEELGDQAALGRLRLHEPAAALRVAVARPGAGQRAAAAQRARRARRHHPVAVGHRPVGARDPRVGPSGSAAAGDGGGWGDHRERAGLEPERGAAGEAAVVLEVHACVAGRAVERAHEAFSSLVPRLETQPTRPFSIMFASANHPRSSHPRVPTPGTGSSNHPSNHHQPRCPTRPARPGSGMPRPAGTRCSAPTRPDRAAPASWATSTSSVTSSTTARRPPSWPSPPWASPSRSTPRRATSTGPGPSTSSPGSSTCGSGSRSPRA